MRKLYEKYINILFYFILLAACDSQILAKNLDKKNDVVLGVAEIQELHKYYDSTEELLKVHGSSDSLKMLNWADFIKKVEKNCSGNIICIKNMANKEKKIIVDEYYNFSSLQNKKIIPFVDNNKDNCYEDKALVFIDSKNKTISFKQACRDNVLDYHILGYKVPDGSNIENYRWEILGSIENDGEIDRKFTFMPAGVNKWVIITNGKRVVYIPHGRFKREVGLGEEYHIK